MNKTTLGAACASMLCMLAPATAQTVAPPARAASAASPNGVDGGAPNKDNFFDNWAVGLAVVRPKGNSVSTAQIVNGVVRVEASSRHEASLLVARHFYPFSNRKECVAGRDTGKSGLAAAADIAKTCLGAMVGVGLGTSSGSGTGQLINFVGVGLTVGGETKDTKTNWHFGLGLGRRFNVKTLGDGFSENEAPPPGETQVRYKTRDVRAPFGYFTVHW